MAVTYHDATKNFGAIEIFTAFPELNSILKKVNSDNSFKSFSDIVVTSYAYHFTSKLHEDYPEAAGQLSKGHAYDLKSNTFERLPQAFLDEKPRDGFVYLKILGRIGTKRAYKYIKSDYVNKVSNLDKWKVLVPAANGSGALGEVLATPLIGQPLIGHTESFISIGSFESEREADAALKYVKSKFARCLLGVLKATQHNPPEKWKHVPLQDFTPMSDIDWSQSISDIDKQLYEKYGLDEHEINFIETHVKEMK